MAPCNDAEPPPGLNGVPLDVVLVPASNFPFPPELRVLRGTGVVSAYINAALPQPLKVSCKVEGERMVDGQRVGQLLFVGLSDTVVDSLAKLIFRHHRRLVAGSRLASR